MKKCCFDGGGGTRWKIMRNKPEDIDSKQRNLNYEAVVVYASVTIIRCVYKCIAEAKAAGTHLGREAKIVRRLSFRVDAPSPIQSQAFYKNTG